jgi:hypothetical protein
MTVTTEDGDRQNMFAKEPQMIIEENYVPHNERAERLNGRVAMISLTLAMISYATTGTLAFGIW